MNNIYVKRFWKEENIIFYIHFQDETAIQQIEFINGQYILTSIKNPINGDSMLFDQDISMNEMKQFQNITKEEFNCIWESHGELD